MKDQRAGMNMNGTRLAVHEKIVHSTIELHYRG
jgi:hypothetical protein